MFARGGSIEIYGGVWQAVCWLLALLLSGCSSTPTELSIEPDDWVFEKRAITLNIKAPVDLNSVSGRPHAMAIGVFQLNDPNTFTGLAVTAEGAVELLQKGRIDETVANFTVVNIRPGEKKNVVLNRSQTAQYVGLIAGYYHINPATDVKVFNIPLRAQKRGVVESGLAALGLIADEASAYPDKLTVYIDLGRSGTRQMTTDPRKALGEGEEESELQWMEKLQVPK